MGEMNLGVFLESAFNSNDLGIKQVVRKAIEIRLKANNNISFYRDLENIH